MKDDKALATFLQTLKKNKLSYAYSHSYLCSIIFHKIIDCFEWKTPNIKEKLSYVAFFHDISLQESQMIYNSEAQLENSNLEKSEKQLILNHANLSASIVTKFASIPSGVDTILKEHHGSKTGLGFPETLSIAISPLSMMFVVVENFVDEFLKLGPEPKSEDLEEIFKKLVPKYTKVTYLQTITALQEMTQGKKTKSA